MRAPLYVVDGYSIIFRSYFAFIKTPLRSPEGKNTSAVFGFFRFLFQLLRERRDGRIAVAFDSPGPTFRSEIYPAYKATREKAPDDLREQIPRIERILGALDVPCIKREGYEADDIIAILAEACRRDGRQCYILSGDKDLLQLVDDTVKILFPGKTAEGYEVWGSDQVYQNRGVPPRQILDYLALVGDSTDNIPGVPGIGDKTATKLLARFEDLDDLYARIDEVESKSQRRKLLDGRDSAYLSRRLAELRTDFPLDPASLWEGGERKPDPAMALELFHSEGIRSFDEELGGSDGAGEDDTGSLERLTPGRHACVLALDELDSWIDEARSRGTFALDSETDSVEEMQANPIGFSLATGAGRACYIPLTAKGLPEGAGCLDEDTVRERLASLLTDPAVRIVGQNLKYDYKVIRRWGIEMAAPYFDTMVAAWVLESTETHYGLDRLARNHLGYETIKYTDIVDVRGGMTLESVDIKTVTDYAAEDADIAYRLYEVFRSRLEERGLDRVFFDVEMPNVKILAEMELAGIRVKPDELARLSHEFEAVLADAEREIFALAGHEFNIGSTKQLQEVLFVERKLKPLKRTKTGWSTDSQVLEALAEEDPVCAGVLKHRYLSKLKSTYVDALPMLINPETGRLHTHYLQTGTATGRLSSKDPNLQNIPIRETEGRKIRTAFTAPEGFTFLSADYSQIELVVLAELSADPMLVEAFRSGKDVHRQTAALLYGTDEHSVSAAMRAIGKTINFGVIYGMSAFRLARDMRIARAEAELFIETYFARYSGVREFIDRTIREAEKRGYVETMSGRRRPVPRIMSSNRTEKRAEERIAVNTSIQGSAADIIKRAMIDIFATLGEMRSRLILQIHDELLLEVALDEREEVRRMVRSAMEGAAELSVPLSVQLDEGRNWGSLH